MVSDSNPRQAVAAPVSKLGYVEFTTPDPDRLIEYYASCLGFHIEERSSTRPTSPRTSTTTAS